MRGDDDSIVLSDISSHCTDSEQSVMTCPPVDQADNGDYQQSELLFGRNSMVECTRLLAMLSSSTNTGNLPVSWCALIVLHSTAVMGGAYYMASWHNVIVVARWFLYVQIFSLSLYAG